MSSILTPEKASLFGCLDSTAIADGEAGNAHVLRVLARNSNRLVAQGEPMLSLMFDSSTDTAFGDSTDWRSGSLQRFLPPLGMWTPLVWGPLVVPKKSVLRTAELQVWVQIEGTTKVYLQVGTNVAAIDFGARSTANNVLTMTGDGTTNWLNFSLTGIPLGGGDVEHLSLFVGGEPSGNALTTGTFGSPSSGTIDRLTATILTHTGATWNDSSSDPTGGYMAFKAYVLFQDGAGANLVAPRIVTWADGAVDQLQFSPPLSDAEVQLCLGHNFKICELSKFRLGSVSINSEDMVMV